MASLKIVNELVDMSMSLCYRTEFGVHWVAGHYFPLLLLLDDSDLFSRLLGPRLLPGR